MSKIQAVEIQKQVFTCEDGKQFATLEAAEKHQARIDAGEFEVQIPADVQAYINANGLTGRAVAQAANAISKFRKFLESWDGEEVAFNQEAADKAAAKAAKGDKSEEAAEAPEAVEADNDLL